jgi:hypothetical protein
MPWPIIYQLVESSICLRSTCWRNGISCYGKRYKHSNHMFCRILFNGSQNRCHSRGRRHFTYCLRDKFLTNTHMAFLNSPRQTSGWYLKSGHKRLLSDTYLFIKNWQFHRLTVYCWSLLYIFEARSSCTYITRNGPIYISDPTSQKTPTFSYKDQPVNYVQENNSFPKRRL